MSRRAGVPLGPLAVLTAAVLAAHWMALREAPGLIAMPRVAGDLRLSLRSVPAEPTVPRTVPAGAVAAARTPPARPRTRPAAARAPVPADAQAAPEPSSAPAATAERSAPGPEPLVPPSALWHYEATSLWRGVPAAGKAQLTWQLDGNGYEASLAIDLPSMPARLQRSTGRIGPQGVVPLRFSERVRSEEAAHFDREGGRIVFSSNRPPVALESGAQDPLSVLLQLSALMAGEPSRFAAGQHLVVQVAGTRDADRWVLAVDGVEEVALPGGTVAATKLTRAARHQYDPRLELWLRPGPAYGPVRLRLTWPHGDWVDLQWSGTDKR